MTALGRRRRLPHHAVALTRPSPRERVRQSLCPSALERRKKIKEVDRQWVLAAVTLLLVVPVVAILGYLVVKAWPVLGAFVPAGEPARTT